MNPRKLIAIAAGGALLATGLFAPTVRADGHSGGTVATLTLTGGFLSISVPSGTNEDPVDLGAATPTLLEGVQASASLGVTTVEDERNATTGWTVTASSTAFTQVLDGTGQVPAEAASIANSNVAIVVPLDTVVEQASGLLPGFTVGDLFVPTAGTTGSEGGPIGHTVASLSGLLGLLDTTNAVAYNPTVTVTVPADTPNGTYRGTVTQTVSAQS
jgi:hypothetical protein